MITRKEYMEDSSTLHHLYWLEVAQEAGLPISPALLDACRKNITKDLRDHFNSTPLAAWDALGLSYQPQLNTALKKRGDGWSLSAGACAGKAMARHLLEKEGLTAWWYGDTIAWAETASELFYEMLGCLPPEVMEHGGFLVGEASDHVANGTEYPEATFSAFMKIGDKFYKASRPLTRYQFSQQIHHGKPLRDLREALAVTA